MNKRVILKKLNTLLFQVAKFVFSCALLYVAYNAVVFAGNLKQIATDGGCKCEPMVQEDTSAE